MTKTKSTKRALLMSGLALLMCVSMLIGSTFAWFTDSVSNGVNKIVSGNLDVELYHATMNQSKAAKGQYMGVYEGYVDVVDSTTKLFLNEDGEDMLWEPGAVSTETFRIKNAGTLALKYQFKLEIANATQTPEGKDLTDILLLMVDKLSYNENGYPSGQRIVDFELLGDGVVIEDTLLPGAYHDYWFGIEWEPTDIDNEFNVKGGLSLDLGVVLLATQLTYEKDNGYNGDQYDAGATYPDYEYAANVSDQTALNDAIASGEDEVILSAGDYTLPSVSNGEVTISGTKDSVITVEKPNYGGSNVTLNGVTVKGSGYATGIQHVDTVTYNNATIVGDMCLYGEKVVFNNCTFELDNQYIWTYGAKEVEFNNCTFNTTGKAILVYNEGAGASKVTVKGCTFNATAGAKAGAIANQNCAAIEIDNYGGMAHEVITENNTYSDNFSGEWRIKSYTTGNAVTVNGTEYTQIAVDGKLMTIDADKNVTVQ